MTTEYTGETIDITPDTEATLEFMAVVFVQKGFEDGAYAPMASVLEQARFLQRTNPAALQRVIDRLEARDHMRSRVFVTEHLTRTPRTPQQGPA